MHSSKVHIRNEELVLKSLNASSLIKLFVMPCVTRTEICVYKFEKCSHIKYRFYEESVNFVHYSVQESCLFFWYLFSALNLTVGWKLFAFKRNSSIFSLFVLHHDMMSLINLFQKMGVVLLCASTLAKATAILVPITDPCDWR